MKSREINELASILVHEYGAEASRLARQRQDSYARDPDSELFRLWASIAKAAARLLREQSNRPRRPALRNEPTPRPSRNRGID